MHKDSDKSLYNLHKSEGCEKNLVGKTHQTIQPVLTRVEENRRGPQTNAYAKRAGRRRQRSRQAGRQAGTQAGRQRREGRGGGAQGRNPEKQTRKGTPQSEHRSQRTRREEANTAPYAVCRASRAAPRASGSCGLQPGSRRKIALALACRIRMHKACLWLRSSVPESWPVVRAMLRARAFRVQRADLPQPPDGSATRGMKEMPWR